MNSVLDSFNTPDTVQLYVGGTADRLQLLQVLQRDNDALALVTEEAARARLEQLYLEIEPETPDMEEILDEQWEQNEQLQQHNNPGEVAMFKLLHQSKLLGEQRVVQDRHYMMLMILKMNIEKEMAQQIPPMILKCCPETYQSSDQIKTVTLSHCFDQRIGKYFAAKFPSLTTLICGIRFNHPIDQYSLPYSLTSLTFGELFNLPLADNVWLPPSLLTLRFGYCFNQPVEPGYLPSSLTELEFGEMFNQEIEPMTLPKSLLTLRFNFYFNQPIKSDTLPVSLTALVNINQSPI
ncbi:hypothetical protein SAMD00019534_030030 [Acytostelium subglobosum LB1]|uniref:hypothetical protein n=1 Tax=Acytostelium subglobosum LB1 TaxID=1410327 RepID=UPI0006449239|nr:hypothetical protein SAMD00019534_030030 [Acytostelium subglobosum LB1]GAM19828.1 hypothetical protein SAMD00019534_030030 [Acytostelium subglobosum LB1]|eukprot:XP_012756590.1 hypothetical protein SAMD00019534_030030 [Acytostelium subglobosum LB1]